MDSIRYYVALGMLISVTPMILFWLLIHPFVQFWRRIGPGRTYPIVAIPIFFGMVALFLVRKPLLTIEYGTNYPLVICGISCYVVHVFLGVFIHRQLTPSLILGLPELARERHPQGLVTEGIFARVRHPRYIQFLIALLGLSLFSNYLACYVLFAIWLPVIYLIVLLEERELRERFGKEYEEYCRRVPRFLPKFGGGS